MRANEAAAKEKIPLVTHLVSNNIVDATALASAAANEFGIPLFDLNSMDMEVAATKLVGEGLIRKHHSLPLFKRANRLFVAVSDPTNFQGLDEIKFNVGMNTEAVLVEENKLTTVIEKVLEEQESTQLDDIGDDDLDDLDIVSDEDSREDGISDADVDDAPVVRYVNKLLLDAINKGASDLHFEPYEKRYRVRFRVDGVLKEVASPPVNMANKIAARIKVISRLDISEKRVPQDGRIKMKISRTRSIDFRVSTCPMLFGEKIVMRILDPSSASLGIEMLGYEPEQQRLYEENLFKPYGMMLITGPTGSGKTVSLYTGINMLNQPGVNISTAEDPAEIVLEGVNQVNVNVKQGLTFAAALKSFLRQDPDVILIGEIRDLETAEIAIKAAQTGHMVMATLHTNDAPQTINRMIQMGVPPYNIASALNLIVAQRLARRLCKHCKQPVDIPHEALLKEGFTEEDLAETFQIYGPKGCDQCADGYKGRVGIYQVMPISDEMARLIMTEATSLELAAQAEREGIPDLRMSGLKKVKDGLTSLEEINRVTIE